MRIFIYGYHGLGNVGAESRLVAIVDKLSSYLPTTELVVSSFSRHGLKYLRGARVQYVHPATYAVVVGRYIRQSDLTLLVEGNMLTDQFTPHMVRAFTQAMRQAAASGTPCIPLAVDSGPLRTLDLSKRVVESLNQVTGITTRTAAAAEALQGMGVVTPIEVTADCAVSMDPPSGNLIDHMANQYRLTDKAVGLFPVDFFMYPVDMSLVGRRSAYVKWPFRGTWPNDGRQRSRVLVEEWASLGRALVDRNSASTIVVGAMDPSDRLIVRQVAAALRAQAYPVREVYGTDHSPAEMAAVIARLRYLVTSRYHATVLALVVGTPYVALGHDTRTRFISRELDLEANFVAATEVDWTKVTAARLARIEDQAVRNDVLTRMRLGLTELKTRDVRNYEMVQQTIQSLVQQGGSHRGPHRRASPADER
jgi:polysaccharide pyruvyl transferase WcaK-like protein